MSTIRGVVVGHGELAAALIDAVAHIAGDAVALTAVSNTDCDRGTLEARITEAVRELPAWQQGTDRTILLTGDLATMATLRDAHPGIVTRINLGGIHHRTGRDEHLRYLYLDQAEVALVRRLAEDGAEILAQDLPTTRAVRPDALL